MKTDKIIRMRLTTYRRIRRQFPAERGETIQSYFERLSKYIEQRQLNKWR